MASVAECEQALQRLAQRLAAADPATKRRAALDRSLSCTVTDLAVTFAGRLHDGELSDIQQSPRADGQVRMAMSSDDLIKLVDGQLNLAAAFATGRVKIDAGVLDLIKLRSLF